VIWNADQVPIVVEHLKQTGNLDETTKQSTVPAAYSTRSSDTSSPPHTAQKVYTPPSPVNVPKESFPTEAMEFHHQEPDSPRERHMSSRFEDIRRQGESNASSARPLGVPRTYSNVELSTIDQKWGRLFEHGEPTPRLGQFLRGLANHIVSVVRNISDRNITNLL
jgi:hypothetical protein